MLVNCMVEHCVFARCVFHNEIINLWEHNEPATSMYM